MTTTNEAPNFNNREIAKFLFPERFVGDRLACKFVQDSLLVSLGDKYGLQRLLGLYQSEYFGSKINDPSWLKSHINSIVSMSVNGSTPFIDWGDNKDWVPPCHDEVVAMDFLGQRLKLRHAGTLGGTNYHVVRVETKGSDGLYPKSPSKHEQGCTVLFGLLFGDNELIKYRTWPIFESVSYQTRVSVEIKNATEETIFVKALNQVSPLKCAVFGYIDPSKAEKEFEGKQKELGSSGKKCVAKIETEDRSGTAEFSISYFVSSGRNTTLECDIEFEIKQNIFWNKDFVDFQMNAVDAMRHFITEIKRFVRQFPDD